MALEKRERIAQNLRKSLSRERDTALKEAIKNNNKEAIKVLTEEHKIRQAIGSSMNQLNRIQKIAFKQGQEV